MDLRFFIAFDKQLHQTIAEYSSSVVPCIQITKDSKIHLFSRIGYKKTFFRGNIVVILIFIITVGEDEGSSQGPPALPTTQTLNSL